MPLYEYLCTACGHRFERIRKFSDAPLTECPACGGTVEKQISSPAIQFKGAGWYVNDYAKAGSGRDSGATKSGESSKAAPEPSKTDKTETKSDSAAPAASTTEKKQTGSP